MKIIISHLQQIGHRQVAAIILFSGILFGATNVGDWSLQAYMDRLKFPESWFGIVLAFSFVLGGLAGQFGHHLEKRVRPTRIFPIMLCVACLSYFLSGAVLGLHGIFFLILSVALYGFGSPLVRDALNKRVSSERRATILSTASLASRFVFMPVSLAAGAIESRYGIGVSLLALCVFLGIAGGLALIWLRLPEAGNSVLRP